MTAPASRVSDRILCLTRSTQTVTTALATSLKTSPRQLLKKLYHNHDFRECGNGERSSANVLRRDSPVENHGAAPSEKPPVFHTTCHLDSEPTQDDLDRAAKCGDFGRRPSNLFLKMYVDVLAAVDRNMWSGVVSPPLLGSRGVVTVSIISVIPDIIQHHYDCLVAVQHEVFLATNFWQASKSSEKICEALRELSIRAEKRGRKVVVKIMYDRANLQMLFRNRVYVEEDEWLSEAIKLPKRSEIPWIDLELVNYHHLLLGTFHPKFMIVDRKVALVTSNNVQDRPNMEMMVHLEGPIVDSLYDMALICWSKPMHPPLPLLNQPYRAAGGEYKFGMDNEYSTIHNLDGSGGADLYQSLVLLSEVPDDGKTFISGRYQTITEHLNAGNQPNTYATLHYEPTSPSDEYMPHIFHEVHAECPMVLVNRGPKGSPRFVRGGLRNPQDAAWLAGLKYAKRRVFIQSPTLNAKPVVQGVLDAARRGVECVLYVDVGFNDGGEALPGQGGTNEQVAKKMYASLTEQEKQNLRMFWYTGKDQGRPLNALVKKRNCHIKLMIIDDAVGIVGSGNQDTQSWYHSQEVNVMIDNPKVCQEWLDAIRRNQNTHLHELQKDGVYRDADGNVLTDSAPIDRGILGMIRNARITIARVCGRSGP